jgi:DNA (cytosine-5)-methyltransferase 1
MSDPVGIELFCGCGGLSTGFLDAGVHIVGGFDVDRRSIEAYNYNHGHRGSQGYVLDLSVATGTELLERCGIPHVSILLGGPPCQPFSIAGKRRGADDRRAGLVTDFVRLAGELRPDALMFENVPNLAAMDGGCVLDTLVTGLERLGYRVAFEIRAAADHGVPQMRRRLILVAILGLNPRLPEPTHGPRGTMLFGREPYRTCRDALSDLPPAGDFGECGVYNHEPTEHSADMLQRFATLKPGEREVRSFHDRLHPDRPSYTLRAGNGNFSPLRPVHYSEDRVITVRESARLQGFGDAFIWPDWIPRLQQYRQVGNAVPPPVGAAVARSLGQQLSFDLAPARFAGQPETRLPAITLTDEERRSLRRKRTRGASLGNAVLRPQPVAAIC